MNMVTPPPDIAAISALQSKLISALRPILPEHALLWEPEDTIPYECDGLAAYRRMPLAVALPETEEQVQQSARESAVNELATSKLAQIAAKFKTETTGLTHE